MVVAAADPVFREVREVRVELRPGHSIQEGRGQESHWAGSGQDYHLLSAVARCSMAAARCSMVVESCSQAVADHSQAEAGHSLAAGADHSLVADRDQAEAEAEVEGDYSAVEALEWAVAEALGISSTLFGCRVEHLFLSRSL